jgi:hypothetical protein
VKEILRFEVDRLFDKGHFSLAKDQAGQLSSRRCVHDFIFEEIILMKAYIDNTFIDAAG